jgi:hypothetical protein
MTSDAGIPLNFEAVRNEDPDAGKNSMVYFGNDVQFIKRPGQPLFLTLSDLMGRLDAAWLRWVESEHEEHYFSHDGEGCDFDQGIPPENCLVSDNEEDGEEGHDEGEEEMTFGTKMTMKEHIDRAVFAAYPYDHPQSWPRGA